MTDREQIDPSIITRFQYFSSNEWQRRYQAVLESLEAEEIDAFIVTSTENIFWLTGFQTTGYYFFQALVISRVAEPFILTRQMENIGAITRTWLDNCYYYYDTQNPVEQLAYRILEIRDVRVIGYEKDSSLFPASYEEQLKKILSGYTFQNTRIVERLRKTKSHEELAVMNLAAKATEAGMLYGINLIKDMFKTSATTSTVLTSESESESAFDNRCLYTRLNNLIRDQKENLDSNQLTVLDSLKMYLPQRETFNENDIAAAIQYGATRAGGEYPACPPFVASGPRGYIGHATWEGREIKRGDIIFIEIGGCKYRYHTAMMRTVYVGSELPPIIKEAQDIINETLSTCMTEMKPGVPIYKIDNLSKQIMNNNSFGYINHVRFGYSIGCAFSPGWGEDNVITIKGTEESPFEEGMVFHLIPFMMIPNIGTVGISETVKITKEGAVSLFNFPREIFTV